MAEAACDAIKLEGGIEQADKIRGIVSAGIPAIGHLGLTPQSVSALGGYRVQGKNAILAKKIIDNAKALEEAVPSRSCSKWFPTGYVSSSRSAPMAASSCSWVLGRMLMANC